MSEWRTKIFSAVSCIIVFRERGWKWCRLVNNKGRFFSFILARKCGENMEFREKVSACPNTCNDLTAEDSCDEEPERGCACKNGYVMSGFECVKVDDCGCTFQNQYYKVCITSDSFI